MSKLVAFVCSPYNAYSQSEIELNVTIARMMARRLWKNGYAVICPQSNSSFFGGEDIKENNFYKGYEEILRRCDAIKVAVEWRTSEGCRREVKLAKELGLYFIDGLPGEEDV